MLEQEYLNQVRRALRQEGIWGASARRFLDELSDHFRTAVEALRKEGQDGAAAERAALQALGAPEAVAAASRDMLQASLPARRPWLVTGLELFLAVAALAVGLSFLLIHMGSHKDHPLMSYSSYVLIFRAGVFLANWAPWVLGIGFLAWMSARVPLGWKALFIGCAAVGAASGCVGWSITLPTNGAGSGSATCTIDFLAEVVERLFLQKWDGFPMNSPLAGLAMTKLLVPLAACWGVRAFSRLRADGSLPGQA